jgi:HemY protein
MAAEASHALQDKAQRQHHLDQALAQVQASTGAERQSLLEGTQLRAARWSLDDRDATASLARLSALPPAVGRRMAAMRLQLRAARLAGQPAKALETAEVIASNAPLSVRQIKKSVRYGGQMELRTAFRFEIEAYNHLIDTEDRMEGVKAFNEKRKANFKGC